MLPSVIGGPCGCFMGLVGPASDGRREFTGVLLALAESLQSGLISTRLMAPGRDYTGSHPAGHWGAVTLQGESRPSRRDGYLLLTLARDSHPGS